MKLNLIEYWLVNNPIRTFFQNKLELAWMRKHSPSANFKNVLEIGCGQGVGAKLIAKNFSVKNIHAIDLDLKMIARANKFNAAPNITFAAQDICHMQFASNTFNATFNFGVIHHIPNWQHALNEVFRTLDHGGVFFFEEFPTETWQYGLGIPAKHLLKHPYNDMFTTMEFKQHMQKLGFEVKLFVENQTLGLKYIYGYAVKP